MRLFTAPVYNALRTEGGAVPPDPVADPAAIAPGTDPAPPEPSAGDPAKAAPLPQGVLNELTRLRAGKREADERAQRAAQEAADARALAERLAKGEKVEPQTGQQHQAAPLNDAELDRRADYKLFLREVADVRSRGITQYGPKFNDTIRALHAIGADQDGFVEQVMAVDRDNAHVLLDGLAQDLERTVSLVNMTPSRRIVELTKMSLAAQKKEPEPKSSGDAAAPKEEPAPKQSSRAPRPAPAIEPSTTRTVDWRTDPKLSDDEWSRAWDHDRAERAKARMGL